MNKKFDREDILKTAIDLFNCQGYTALGVNEILEKTGMSKGAFYNAFESKENYFKQCLDKYCDTGVLKMNEKLSKNLELPAIQRLQNLYFEALEEQSAQNYAGCLLNNSLSELGGSNAELKETMLRQLERMLKVIEPVVLEAQQKGDIADQYDPKHITQLLHLTFFGVLTHLKGSHDHQLGKEVMRLVFDLIKK